MTYKTLPIINGFGKDIHATADHLRIPARAEFIETGKLLRKKVPHKLQAKWKPSPNRQDPVDMTIASSVGRVPELVPIRYGRMSQSPFAFFRGSAEIMAADLANTPSTGLWVQSCGDCHLANFGGFATPERRMIFEINDFDETLPAPWEWDLKRLAASIVIAGRNNKISLEKCRAAAAAVSCGYRKHMHELAELPVLEEWYSHLKLEKFIKITKNRKLLNLRSRQLKQIKQRPLSGYPELVLNKLGPVLIKDNPPLIFHPDKLKHAELIRKITATFKAYRLSLPEERRILFERYHFADLAFKVVGVGSVGTICAIALFFATNDDPLILQIKEARPSVLAPYTQKSDYANQGQRVVVGQRIMQAASDVFLGWTSNEGHEYYIRQLNDMKFKPIVEKLNGQELAEYAKTCGWTLARAHARSGNSGVIAGYLGTSKIFDAAIADFAVAYAQQNEQDYAAFVAAVQKKHIKIVRE